MRSRHYLLAIEATQSEAEALSSIDGYYFSLNIIGLFGVVWVRWSPQDLPGLKGLATS